MLKSSIPFTETNYFSMFMGFVIIANAIIIGIETDLGEDVGLEVRGNLYKKLQISKTIITRQYVLFLSVLSIFFGKMDKITTTNNTFC
jgi:hypothetical protein